MTPQPRDWHELAEKVSQEMDPGKLEGLIDELNSTLGRDERRRRQDASSAQQSSQEQKQHRAQEQRSLTGAGTA